MDLATLISKGLVGPLTAPPAREAEFPFGLGRHGLHEIAEAAYGDRAATTGFLLAAAPRPSRRTILLWVTQASSARDMGRVPEAALREATGGKARRLGIVTRHTSDALWAIEEAIVSGVVSHVIAEVDSADFTATRRLTLASERHGVPVTLLLPHTCEGATAAATRWRVCPQPSAPNRYDPRAPGHARWRVHLERCRAAPALVGQAFDLEWNDETLSLHMVPGMVTGSPAPDEATPHHVFPNRRAG
ncbi:ImuA family protein [Hyphomonas sp. NPDC076900]|uniref:ImuA family protein n=1 Tax=unclassified Hyphomonas TaxID=2630699 RepID=UPI003D01E7F6